MLLHAPGATTGCRLSHLTGLTGEAALAGVLNDARRDVASLGPGGVRPGRLERLELLPQAPLWPIQRPEEDGEVVVSIVHRSRSSQCARLLAGSRSVVRRGPPAGEVAAPGSLVPARHAVRRRARAEAPPRPAIVWTRAKALGVRMN